MTRDEAKQLLPIIKAFSEGKTIQETYEGGWIDIESSQIPFDAYVMGALRIKPSPKYRPFANAEECWNEMLKHQPVGWVKINGDDYNLITTINTCVYLSDILISYIDAFDNYTFTDGAPFGVKVGKEE